jgi:hypothetical protein
MIIKLIFPPYAHLTGGHGHHGVMQHHGSGTHAGSAMVRRIIFIEISASQGELKTIYDDFNINIKRTLFFFADLNLHTGEVLRVQETPGGSGWGSTPTPMF